MTTPAGPSWSRAVGLARCSLCPPARLCFLSSKAVISPEGGGQTKHQRRGLGLQFSLCWVRKPQVV